MSGVANENKELSEMDERELKHWVIDYIGERLDGERELVNGRFDWLNHHIKDSVNELYNVGEKIVDSVNSDFDQRDERMKAFEAELKSALLLIHEMKGKLDAVMAYSERARTTARQDEAKQGKD